jgi:hypothetical protein
MACCNEIFHDLSRKTRGKKNLLFGKDVWFEVLTAINMKITAF